MKTIKTIGFILLTLIFGLVMTSSLLSCSNKIVPNISKPSSRDINKAMYYSSWQYVMPNKH